MAVGLGQVLELGLAADDRDRGVGQAGEIARQVAHVVQAVLDVPVVADQGRELLGTGLVGGQRGECIALRCWSQRSCRYSVRVRCGSPAGVRRGRHSRPSRSR